MIDSEEDRLALLASFFALFFFFQHFAHFIWRLGKEKTQVGLLCFFVLYRQVYRLHYSSFCTPFGEIWRQTSGQREFCWTGMMTKESHI
jgi:hypothetical protein